MHPSSRHGQLHRILHAIEKAEPGTRTDYAKPFIHFQQLLSRRGIVVVLSDFYEQPATIVKTVAPLRFRGNEVVLFHVLDPQEVKPVLSGPSLLVDMETDDAMEVSPEYTSREYRQRIDAHIENLKAEAQRAGLGYFLATTDRPLDAALREYLAIRQGRM